MCLCMCCCIVFAEAVMSARLSNANVLLELQEKLKGMNATITTLDKQARELEQENAVLQ